MEQTKIWDHFQNNDEIGDVFAGALPRYEFLARRVESGAQVLNIGVGKGVLERLLADKGCIVSCLDPSESAIDRLREELALGMRAQVGYSQAMPFQNDQFDVVIMSEVLEHLSDEVLDLTLIEVGRVLKSGGHFIGTVPANENLPDNFAVCPRCECKFHRWGHVQSFSPTRVRDLLLENNFVVIRNEIRAFVDWRRKGITNFVKNLFRYLLGRAGAPVASPNIYFEAEIY